MSSTTQILSQIQTDFKKHKSLECHLPGLVKTFNSTKNIIFVNMNAKQKLTQLQQLIQAQVKQIQQSLQKQKIDLQALDEEEDLNEQVDQEQIQQENYKNQEQEEISQNLDQNQEQEIQNQELQFPEPQFENDKMVDQGQQIEQEQENNDQQGQEQGQQDEQFADGEQDVGLYGQQLNDQDQDMENYQNQFDEEEYKEFQKQFGDAQAKEQKKSKNKKSKINDDDEQNPDDHIEDNFDHFRQIQLQNEKVEVQQKPVRTQLDGQIDRLEGKIIGKKDWAMKGQIKARQRPSNSLLEYDLQFNSGIKYSHEITEQRNTELQELIKKRILTDMFDDRTRFVNSSHIREHFGSLKQVSRQKSQMGLGQLYQSQFKNFLGIGQNKNDKLKAQIMDSFKQLNYHLDSLSNFSFVPKPSKDAGKKGQSEAIIVEEKVPLTLWNGQRQVKKDGKHSFESQKQVDNQAKRLKNKRIARQRKKQQQKKKLNKKIEYGGITKFQAQAKKKAQMNNKPLKIDGVNMKYNKSASFFKNINQNKGGKPNPDVSKMKI